MSADSEEREKSTPQGDEPGTVIRFVPKRERPIDPRREAGNAPPSGEAREAEAGDEDGDDPGPSAA